MVFGSVQFPTRPAIRWILVLLAVVTLGNLAGLFGVGVHTDESYYWVWSRYLEWGYFDHPPLAAWMIRLFSELLGTGKFSLRFPAMLAWLVTMFVVFRLSERIFTNPAAGWLAMLTLASIPIFQIGFHIVGPDSPLMLFTALTYYFVFMAVDRSDGRYWLLAGGCLGLALLGKYTAVLLPGIIFIALISNRETRKELGRFYPWAGLLLAALLFIPVVYWNYQHDWISFYYQWGHGTQGNKGFSFHKTLDYFVQQMSSVLPWVLFAMMFASFRVQGLVSPERRKTLSLLITGFWFPLLFFGFTGSFSVSMHNWPVIAYIPGSVLLGGTLAQWIFPDGVIDKPVRRAKAVKYVVVASFVFSVLLVNLARFPQWVSLLDKPEKLAGSSIVAVWGWDSLAADIKLTESRHGFSSTCQILFVKDYNNAWLGYYHVAGEIAYQLRNPDRIMLEPVPHQKQYNLWSNTNLANTENVCMAIAGPANHPVFPEEWTKKVIGKLRLEKIHTITLPDTTSSYYAIYLIEDKEK